MKFMDKNGKVPISLRKGKVKTTTCAQLLLHCHISSTKKTYWQAGELHFSFAHVTEITSMEILQVVSKIF